MNIPEFRSNMREAFNKAENGEVVEIERFGRVYQLVITPFDAEPKRTAPLTPRTYRGDGVELEPGTLTPKNNSSAKALPFIAVGNGEKPSPQVTEILKATGAKFCKAGHLLAPNSNRCLQKGCKYA